jgi:hypothetical protein
MLLSGEELGAMNQGLGSRGYSAEKNEFFSSWPTNVFSSSIIFKL